MFSGSHVIVPRTEDSVVDMYLRFCSTLRNLVMKHPRAKDAASHAQQQGERDMWARLNQARIIDLGSAFYAATYHEADVYTTEHIAGQSWTRPGTGQKLTEEDGRKFFEDITEGGKHHPLDVEHLPFDHVLFMFGPGEVLLNPTIGKLRYDNPTEHPQLMFMGYLVSYDGFVADLAISAKGSSDEMLACSYVRHPNYATWSKAFFLSPWIVSAVIDYVNEHRQIMLENDPPANWKRPKKGRKQFVKHPIPKPYYTVFLDKDVRVQDWLGRRRKAETGTSFEYQHRFDVRAHERCYIRRGPLPLADKLRQKMVDAGYRIYAMGDMHPDDVRRLAERKQPPRGGGEWVAIKVRWIAHDVRPHNDALPYIPAVQSKQEGWEEARMNNEECIKEIVAKAGLGAQQQHPHRGP